MDSEDKKDFYDDLPQHVKDDIDQGLKDVENGDLCSHEEVMVAARLKYSLIK